MRADARSQASGRHISPVRVVRRPGAVAALLTGLLLAGVGLGGFAVAIGRASCRERVCLLV